MINILYFARLSESLGVSAEELEVPGSQPVSDLVTRLRARGDAFESVFGGDAPVLVAINQEMADADSEIKDGDEVAFFPPVTGG